MANHDSAKQSLAKIADSLTVHIDSLQLWDRNPRSIKGDRFNELKARLQRQGQIKPLLVAADGQTVIGGNMRLRAMQELGINEVWISQTEAVTDKDIFDLALTDNEEFGYYEQEQVAELALELGLSPLELKSYALSLGTPTTLDLVVDKFGPEVEEDEVPEVDETETISVLGEVYQLGSHRLMCGDATDDDNLDALFDDVQVDMVYTDPPYGMFLDTDFSSMDGLKTNGESFLGTKGGKVHKQVAGDADDFDPNFIHKVFTTHPNCNEVFLWGADYYAEIIPNRNEGAIIVWDKRTNEGASEEQADSADKLFGSNFELCWSKSKHKREIARIRNGIFGVKNEEGNSKTVHPTQKPVQLASWFFSKWGKSGDVVADHFGGSGSTLIACEQTNRICYMMELDPKYCDVIRKRYAKHIGEKESWQEATPAINVLQAA